MPDCKILTITSDYRVVISDFSSIADRISSYMKLQGLYYRNINIGVFFETGENRNILAEQIIKCMKEQSYIVDVEPIYGDVYICNEDGDMDKYIWKLIKGILYYKINKIIPPDFANYILKRKGELKIEQYGWVSHLILMEIDEAKKYGHLKV